MESQIHSSPASPASLRAKEWGTSRGQVPGLLQLLSEKLGQGFVLSGCSIPSFIMVIYRLLTLHPHFTRVSQGFTVDSQDFSLSWQIKLQSNHHMYLRAALLHTGKTSHSTFNVPQRIQLLRQQHGCLGRMVSQVYFLELKISLLKENKVYIQQRFDKINGKEMNQQQNRRKSLFLDCVMKPQKGCDSATEK